MFTLLIGSQARGTGDWNSDVDVLRLGHSKDVTIPDNIDNQLPVSYIDYELDIFHKLYHEGTLFLYHVFYEGVLLSGDILVWEQLKKNFVVTNNFRESIGEYVDVLSYIDQYPEYASSVLPFLSNIYKCLKNIGIFKLASSGRYVFEKSLALEYGCGLSAAASQILISANNVYERSMPVSTGLMEEFDAAAKDWGSCLDKHIKRILHDI